MVGSPRGNFRSVSVGSLKTSAPCSRQGADGSNKVMLLLQQISNDAKVMQTKAEADLKSAATRSDGDPTVGRSSNGSRQREATSSNEHPGEIS